MSTRTAFVFAGLNGAEHVGERATLALPGFVRRWRHVRAAFATEPAFKAFDKALHAGHRLAETPPTWRWRALVVTAAQLAVAEQLERIGERPDWLCGYSIGDVARSCHGGAASFDQIVAFARALPDLPAADGATAAALTRAQHITDSLREHLRANDVAISTMSPRCLLFAGAREAVHTAIAACRAAGAHAQRIATCPLHTTRQQPLGRLLVRHLRRAPLAALTRRAFSTALLRQLESREDLRRELGENVTHTVDFAAAIRTLHDRHAVTRFVDLGPGRHATRFIQHHDLPVVAIPARELLLNAPLP